MALPCWLRARARSSTSTARSCAPPARSRTSPTTRPRTSRCARAKSDIVASWRLRPTPSLCTRSAASCTRTRLRRGSSVRTDVSQLLGRPCGTCSILHSRARGAARLDALDRNGSVSPRFPIKTRTLAGEIRDVEVSATATVFDSRPGDPGDDARRHRRAASTPAPRTKTKCVSSRSYRRRWTPSSRPMTASPSCWRTRPLKSSVRLPAGALLGQRL